jgi:hypothetical protein
LPASLAVRQHGLRNAIARGLDLKRLISSALDPATGAAFDSIFVRNDRNDPDSIVPAKRRLGALA